MLPLKIHCSYLGHTGYNYHSRNFLRALAGFFPELKVRNFTVCNNPAEYINEIDRSILSEQTLFNSDGSRAEFPLPWNKTILDSDKNGEKIHIILNPINHYYFYDQYNGPKIAYVVWETTEIDPGFFNKLKEFDQLWVVSEWHRQNTIKQGFDANKVFVVPEALDEDVLSIPHIEIPEYKDGRFKFLLFGKWEYRKATQEIIETFLRTFNTSEPIDLILNCDNQFDKTPVEQKLEKFKLRDPRIKVKRFLSREEYINYLRSGHAFVSCSRGEGWNRPLHEAISLGTPSILSNYGGQLEFCDYIPLKVNIIEEKNANINQETSGFHGKWAEPDLDHLSDLMRDAYENFGYYKEIYKKQANQVIKRFAPQKVAEDAKTIITSSFYAPQKEKKEILFVTGGNEGYLPIIEKLAKSFNIFSKNKLVVYGINTEPNIQYNNIINKKIELNQTQDSDKWYFKQRICIQSLADFSDYCRFVWIDGDSIVNKNIDEIEQYFSDLTNYPMPDRHHLKDYTFFSIDKDGNKSDFTSYNEKLIKKFNTPRSSEILAHACLYLYNSACKWFFEEIVSIYEELKKEKNDQIIICNDEGIDNLLRWKYGFDKFLPQLNFETGFNPEYLQKFFELDGPYDFGDPSGWTFIPKNKDKVLYFHGNKDLKMAEQIISSIKTQGFNPSAFYITETTQANFGEIPLAGSTIEIAQKYGWFTAIYHEIFNIHDYDKLKEVSVNYGDIVVDIGANYGAFSRYAISLGAKKVFAFEPDPRFFVCLEKNVRPGDEAFNCAISNYVGESDLFLSEHIGGSTLQHQPNKIIHKTNCFTLNHMFDSGLFDKIDLLKIDTEGSELDIMDGLSDENLLKIRKITLEYHNCFWGNDDRKREKFLYRFQKLNFKTYTLFLGDNNNLQMLYIWQ